MATPTVLTNDLLNVTDRWMVNDQNVMPDVDPVIRYEDLDYMPLITLMASVGNTRQVHDVSWRWPESRAVTFQAKCTNIAAVGAGVEQEVYIQAGVVIGQEVFHGSTRQTFIVTDFIEKIPDSTSPTNVKCRVKIKKRPFTQTTTAITAPVLRIQALRTPTGGFYPIGQSSTPEWHTNFVQLCTNVVSISRTEKAIAQWYGSQLKKDIKEKSQQHKENNERVMWFGQGENEFITLTNEDGKTSNGQLYGTQGIDDRIQTHRTPYTVLDKATILSWIGAHCFGARNSGPKRQLWVCGPDAMQAINEIGENQFVAFPGTEDLGLDIKQFKAWGDRQLAIVEEREFYGDGIDKTDEAGSIYKLNPENLGIRHLQSSFMEVYPIDDPTRDAEALLFRSEWGGEVALEQQMAKLYKLA